MFAVLVLGVASGIPAVNADEPPGSDPAVVGAWTAPFEEGGATPRCVDGPKGKDCKPVAVTSSVLPDGRVLYFNGLEGMEKADGPLAMQYAIRGSNGQARVLDLRHGTPVWTAPTPKAAEVDDISYPETTDPFGVAGVPGRPGDGPAGSTVGAVAPGLAQHPTSPPDDKADNDQDLFCADVTLLPDGRVLAVGGTDYYNEPAIMETDNGDPADVGLIELGGLRATRLYDPATNTFSAGSRMKRYRWYPALVALPNGHVLVAGGTTKVIKNTQGGQVRRTETYDPAKNTWTENYVGPQSETELPQSARLNLMPDGRIYFAGAGHMNSPQFGSAVDEALYAFIQRYDIAAKTWELVGPAPAGARANAFQVMLPMRAPYDSAELMVFGGNPGPNPSAQVAVPVTTITKVHKSGKVENRIAATLHHARFYPSGVVLPDGKVVALGGSDLDSVTTPGLDKTIQIPELYDPAADTWTPMATATRERSYHSSAVLLPDMRVLFGGHSPIGTMYGPHRDVPTRSNDDKDPSFEVWSPPYLLRGERPTITSAPTGLAWGSTFEINTPQADRIESVVLMRLPSAQHVTDSDQRSLDLEFRQQGGSRLSVTTPPDGVAAPPGFYYLVVNATTDKGPVPSVARIVRVGAAADNAAAPQPYADQAPAPTGGTASPPDASGKIAVGNSTPATPPRTGWLIRRRSGLGTQVHGRA
jgi:hypothetical protein